MKRNPAGAGYDDDPRRRLWIAAEGTRLRGLSSYPSRAAVHKALTGDVRRPEIVAPTLRTPYVPRDGRVMALCQLSYRQLNSRISQIYPANKPDETPTACEVAA